MQQTATASPVQFQPGFAFAQQQDAADSLAAFRQRFHFPVINGQAVTYLCGNSLGLQPMATAEFVTRELGKWQQLAVEGHFKGDNPWFHYHKNSQPGLAHIVGAKPAEVVAMNNLSVNLHLMLVSFYRPQGKRTKILMESSAFPSDQYAVETQLLALGYNPDEVIVELQPDENGIFSTESIQQTIAELGDGLALVLLGGINYLSGQVLDMQAITAAAHAVGAKAGFDLAHAAGNIEMHLHGWDVDFAVWCTYKYMNSGPGAVGAIFVHERHANEAGMHRLAGWWGYNEETRFKMRKGFVPEPGAAGWQLSNANILSHAALQASLDVFVEAGMPNLAAKSKTLTAYAEYLIQQVQGVEIKILTPAHERGAQLSMLIENGRPLFDYLVANNVIGDWREPGIIRIAPAPLYNSFADVYRFYEVLQQAVNTLNK